MILTVIIIGGEPQHTARIACDFRVSVRALSGPTSWLKSVSKFGLLR
jgi:hypothetical protein